MIRAVIVDDEQPAVDKLAKLLKESGTVDIKGEFTDPMKALEYVKNTPLDAVFLDVEMPGMNGIELSNLMLGFNGRIAIVFVTAFNEYAVEAFRLNAIDYLMKPLDKERLKETFDRIREGMDKEIYPAQSRICCFDKFKVITEQGEVRFRTAKAEELLAFFIDCKGAEVSRNEIIDNIWGEFDGDRAITHFNTTLYYMKKALLNKGIEITVERIRDRYKLNIDSVDCDYYKFMAFLSSAKTIDDSTICEYEKIADIYTGDYLEGNDFWWAERNRQSVKEEYIQLILKMADYYVDLGQLEKASKLLKTGLEHEPLHNMINYKLVDTFIVMKDRFSAVKYYNMYRQGLKQELNMEPYYEVEKMINRIKL